MHDCSGIVAMMPSPMDVLDVVAVELEDEKEFVSANVEYSSTVEENSRSVVVVAAAAAAAAPVVSIAMMMEYYCDHCYY